MSWWTRLLRRSRLESQLDAELRDHIDRQVAANVAAGMSEPDARRRAQIEFGGVEQVKELCRDVRGTRWIEEFAQDVRYGCRILRKSPAFTLAAVASLALGIGANTAIFSLIDAVILRSLAVREPEHLVELLTHPGTGEPFNAFSYPALVHFRDHARTVEGIIASHSSRFLAALDGAESQLGAGQYVTGNFFSLLGVPALIGRTVQPSDDRPEAALVAVLSQGYWHRRFGADPLVIGRRITLGGVYAAGVNDHPFTIIGVAPGSFHGTLPGKEVDFWIPLAAEPLLSKRTRLDSVGSKWLQLLARRKPGVPDEAVHAELQTLFQTAVVETELARVKDVRPDHPLRKWRLVVEPGHAGVSMMRQQYGDALLVLLAVSGLVLVIACVNVANLLLARATARRNEVGLRLSLGAARSRIVRQLLTESMLLASAGAALGVVLAYVGCQYLLTFFATSRTPVALDVGPDLRVLAFTGVLAVATGLFFGLAPAWRATMEAREASGIGTARVHGSRDRRALRGVLISGQVALSVIMLFCAGLFLRSLHNLRSIDTGFDSSAVLLISTDASRSRLTPEAQRTAHREILNKISGLPGVQAASLSEVTPIEGGGTMREVLLDGDRSAAPRRAPGVHLNWVSPDYFATLKTPVYAGRDFSWQDTVTSPKVAIINQTMARRYFPNENAIGRRVTLDEVTHEIVAVAGDAKYLEIREPVPATLYFNAFQRANVSGQFAIRTAGRPTFVAATARDAIRATAPSITITSVRSLEEQVEASIVSERMLGLLSGFFAGLGLLLSAIGLYGVMAYSISRRTSEIGIRMALGAEPSWISGMVLREALRLTVGGILAGTVVALLLSRGLASLLFGLTPNDPLTIVSVATVMLATGLAAAYFPSRRAGRLDPTVALRAE